MQQSATRQPQRTPYIARYLLAPAAFFHPSFVRINNLRPPNLTISCCCCFTEFLSALRTLLRLVAFIETTCIRVIHIIRVPYIYILVYTYFILSHTQLFICLWYCIRVLHTIRVHNEYIVYIQRSLH